MPGMESVGPRLPQVARRAIEQWLRGEMIDGFDAPGPPRAVFVTLRRAGGGLRGCIGSLSPSKPGVLGETAHYAVMAASRDPRFPPVSLDELPGLHVEVSVLGDEEPIVGISELDPSLYGVIVRDAAGRRGILLPGIEGIADAATQVALAKKKAGIADGSPVSLSRFRVQKWSDAKVPAQVVL